MAWTGLPAKTAATKTKLAAVTAIADARISVLFTRSV
jgi:hypothetical protein